MGGGARWARRTAAVGLWPQGEEGLREFAVGRRVRARQTRRAGSPWLVAVEPSVQRDARSTTK